MKLGLYGVSATLLSFVLGCSPVAFEFQQNSSAATGESAEVSYGPTHTEDTRPRLLDRRAVKSVLDTIFGPSVDSITTNLIFRKTTQMGGACEIGEIGVTPDCSQRSSTQNPAVPTSISGREGYLIRACELIVNTDPAILYSGQKILNTLTRTTTDLPTDAQLQKMYQDFYPGYSLPPELLSSLKNVITQSQSLGSGAFEAWRFVYLVLCESPDWQTP